MANSITHFGILGMHWGQRKARKPSTDPRKIANENFQSRLKKLSDAGRGNDQKAINRIAVKFDKEMADAKALVSSQRQKKVRDTIVKSKQELNDLGEKIAKAYGMSKKKNGEWQIGLDTIPKVAATTFVAHFLYYSANYTVNQVLSGNVKMPRWVGDLAWTTGKIVSNTPIR